MAEAAKTKEIRPISKDLSAAKLGYWELFLLEPFQGQGLATSPPKYLKEVVTLGRESDILTIFDEVKVSMDRTGTFCAFQIEDVMPDVVTISKSLGSGKRAVGAMITPEEIFKKAYGKRQDSSLHTTTFGGLGESCAVAIEALNTLVEDKLIEGALEKGDDLKTRLLELQAKHPGQVVEVLERGLLLQGVRFSFSRRLSPLPAPFEFVTKKISMYWRWPPGF